MAAARSHWLGAALVLMAGCASHSPAIPIYDTPLTGVWLTTDARAQDGHHHPYRLTESEMARVLQGVQVEERDTITGIGLLGSRDGRPAFTKSEIDRLAPHLSEALRKASPTDMASFYMVVSDDNRKRAVTSGGLFVDRQRRLHVMLANWRSIASGGQDYTIAMEVDTRDQPLLPISPHRFRVGYQPADAWIRDGEETRATAFRAYNSVYTDPAKSVVIDLTRVLSSP